MIMMISLPGLYIRRFPISNLIIMINIGEDYKVDVKIEKTENKRK